MIFSIQRDLEDYFHRCGFGDPDQYAVSLATLYDRRRKRETTAAFLSSMSRIRTAFFRANAGARRPLLERRILSHLDAKFKKKVSCSCQRPSRKEWRLRLTA